MHKIISSQPTESVTFTPMNGKVVKVRVMTRPMQVYAGDEWSANIALKALESGAISEPKVNVQVSEASEADLIAAQKSSPTQMLQLEKLLQYLKACRVPKSAPPPLEIFVTNAADIGGRRTEVSIKRDGAGQMTEAVARRVE